MHFSIIHTSARPDKWEDVYLNWLANAEDAAQAEYILVVDNRWGFKELPKLRPQDKVMWATGDRRSYVDNVNLGALTATGDILIVNADDQFACYKWDTYLLESSVLNDPAYITLNPSNDEFVVWCSTGTPKEVERGIIVMPVVSRARYERLGYIFYPLYESMYADNDLHGHAVKDGCLVTAFGPLFPHVHPIATGQPLDPAYKRQNRREAYELGEAVWEARKANGYNPLPHDWKPGKKSAQSMIPTLAVLMPGESFSFKWVMHWTALFHELKKYFNVLPIFGYSSNVYVTRELLLQAALKDDPDFFLWIDDDNLVTIQHVLQLVEDLNEVPEADAVTGWCWSYDGTGLVISAGHFNDNGTVKRLPYDVMMNADSPLGWVDWTGFPCIFMKASMVRKAGKLPFAPISVPSHPMGFTGEDISFCKNAFTRGQARILLDRRVEVEHFKEGALGLSTTAKKAASAVPADRGEGESISSIPPYPLVAAV